MEFSIQPKIYFNLKKSASKAASWTNKACSRFLIMHVLLVAAFMTKICRQWLWRRENLLVYRSKLSQLQDWCLRFLTNNFSDYRLSLDLIRKLGLKLVLEYFRLLLNHQRSPFSSLPGIWCKTQHPYRKTNKTILRNANRQLSSQKGIKNQDDNKKW